MALLGVLALLAGCSGSGSDATPTTTSSVPSTTRAAPPEPGRASPYLTASFAAVPNEHRFGQDPTFTPDGRVLSNAVGADGVQQVYVSELDGSGGRCLTCDQPGPNGYPLARPQGDWIVFCSWRGNPVTLGKPCLGGYGSDLYAVRPDGTKVTRLTEPGDPFDVGEVYDNYHPTIAPDGSRLAWTHVDFRSRADGGTRWTVVVADLEVTDGAISLGEPVVVAPATEVAYETQSWAPDGESLLYTRFGGTTAAEGWMSSELQRVWIGGSDASPEDPRVEQLTDGHPGWDEQAVFTPDGRAVVFMSSRDTPTWYQSVVTAAQTQGYLPPEQNTAFGAFFIATIVDPRFRTDLYVLDLETRAVRRLTDLDSVIPEFTFDASGTRLLWSEGNRLRRTMIGTFDLGGRAPELVAEPVAIDPRWADAEPPGDVVEVPELPEGAVPALTDAPIPDVIVEGAVLYAEQLAALGPLAARIGSGPSEPG